MGAMRELKQGVATWLVAGALTLGLAGTGACGDIIAPPTVGGDVSPSGDVTEDNRPPELTPVDPQTAIEGVELSFSVHATDPDDGQVVTLAMTQGPDTAVFADGKFTWKPPLDTVDYDAGQVKVTVTFSATDDGEPARAATMDVDILVESNVDGDLLPDSLDDDIDGDGIPNDEEAAFGTDVALADTDGDQLNDLADNCKIIANASQEDTDGDGAGNACDPCPNDAADDEDSDGVCADLDNCPTVANAGQDNADGDALGDACDDCPADPDNDQDSDGVCGDVDNCPAVANEDQADGDGDGVGDGCDTCPDDPLNDADDDGVCGDADNCPEAFNPGQADDDADGIGNTCDTCPGQPGTDVDQDGVCVDNCPAVANEDQADGDGDGVGDVCDVCPGDPEDDADQDGVCGDVDNCPSDANEDQADGDTDGVGDVCDACPLDPDNDADGDSVCGDVDNCGGLANPDQLDTDGDQVGDACDDDDDGDGVLDGDDSCPLDVNPQQEDLDGDGLGDVCDPDADGDGILTADGDNCPLVSNPGQDDMDGDGVGLACDPSVAIDPAILPDGTSFDALGDARGETLALVISSSETATALSLQGGAAHLAKGGWLKLNPGGFAAEPRVNASGVSYFRGVDNLGGVHLDGVVDGAVSAVFSQQTLHSVPDLTPAPNGTIWAAVDADISGLYELEGVSAGPAHAKTSVFTDHSGQGPFYGGDGFLYYPYRATVGGNASVAAVGPAGAGADPLPSYDQIYFLALDRADGGPWFCARLYASSAPLFVHLVNGQIAGSASLNGPQSCAALVPVQAPETGVWWVGDEATGSGYRWDPASGEGAFTNVFDGASGTSLSLTPSGEECYLDVGCGQGCHDIFRYSKVTQGFTLIGSLDAYYPKRVVGAHGMFAIVGRDAVSGLADVVGLMAEPQSAATFTLTEVPTTSPVVQAAALSPNGVLWVQTQVKQTDGTTKRQLGAVYGSPGGLTATASVLTYQTAAAVTFSDAGGLAAYALVSVDGDEAGIYVAEHPPFGTLTLTLAEPSVGVHKGVLSTPGSTFGGDLWFSYPSGADPGTGEKTWTVARLGADGAVTIERTGLTSSVKYKGDLGSGHPWLLLRTAEGFAGATLDGGGLVDLTTPKIELTTLYRLRSQSDVWGTLSRATPADPPVVCTLALAPSCWTMPEGAYGFLWGPYVTGTGRVFALTRDVADATQMTIWRNVGPPDPPQQ